MTRWSILSAADWVLERYLKLRPTWLNRITWLVVFAGVLICSQPIWLSVLSAALEKHGEIQLPEGPSPWMGVLLISIGLCFNYAKQKNERGELTFSERDKRDHDARLLSSFCTVTSFDDTRRVLEWVEANHALFKEDREALRSAALFLGNAENEFLDDRTRAKAQEYNIALMELISFMAMHFFVYPSWEFGDRGFQYCLYPDLNPDRGGDWKPESTDLYNRRSDELLVLVDKVRNTQIQFIKTAKAALGAQFQQTQPELPHHPPNLDGA